MLRPRELCAMGLCLNHHHHTRLIRRAGTVARIGYCSYTAHLLLLRCLLPRIYGRTMRESLQNCGSYQYASLPRREMYLCARQISRRAYNSIKLYAIVNERGQAVAMSKNPVSP